MNKAIIIYKKSNGLYKFFNAKEFSKGVFMEVSESESIREVLNKLNNYLKDLNPDGRNFGFRLLSSNRLTKIIDNQFN